MGGSPKHSISLLSLRPLCAPPFHPSVGAESTSSREKRHRHRGNVQKLTEKVQCAASSPSYTHSLTHSLTASNTQQRPQHVQRVDTLQMWCNTWSRLSVAETQGPAGQTAPCTHIPSRPARGTVGSTPWPSFSQFLHISP